MDKLEAMYHEDSASAGARDPLRVRDRELGAGVPHPLRGKLQILRRYSPLVSTMLHKAIQSSTRQGLEPGSTAVLVAAAAHPPDALGRKYKAVPNSHYLFASLPH